MGRPVAQFKVSAGLFRTLPGEGYIGRGFSSASGRAFVAASLRIFGVARSRPIGIPAGLRARFGAVLRRFLLRVVDGRCVFRGHRGPFPARGRAWCGIDSGEVGARL